MEHARAGRKRVMLGFLLVALSLCAAATGQTSSENGSDTPRKKQTEPVFRVNVRLVNVFATVTDSHGAPIAGLTKDDFRILEDGVQQTISVFDKESALPLSIVLAVDTSLSTMRDFKLETSSARKFAHSVVTRPVDHLQLFQVTEDIDQLTGFTSDLGTIDRGIENLRIGAGTSLYDAIFLGSENLIDRQGRKVLVLI